MKNLLTLRRFFAATLLRMTVDGSGEIFLGKKLIGMLLLFTSVASAHTAGFIDLLWWEARESGADNWAQIITPAGEQRSATLIDAPFDWHTGFRIGFTHALGPDCYDVTLAYTHYQTTASNHVNGPVFSAFDGNFFANNTDGSDFGPNYQSASIRWKFFYNTIDLDLGRPFKLDPVLQLHPHIGIKAASINQKIYTSWFNPTVATNFTVASENVKNDFWGIGPTIGVDTRWPIYCSTCQSLHLIGNVTAGLLWGQWHFNEVYSNNSPVNITVKLDSVYGASPMADGLLGLEWLYRFAKSDVSVRLAYEAQVWFDQLQFYSLNLGRLNKPVSLQGGNVEFRIKF